MKTKYLSTQLILFEETDKKSEYEKSTKLEGTKVICGCEQRVLPGEFDEEDWSAKYEEIKKIYEEDNRVFEEFLKIAFSNSLF